MPFIADSERDVIRTRHIFLKMVVSYLEVSIVKRGNIERWTDISECSNLLFFSQLVNELLFDYSIPSNRISTLNSHYLCLDAISAINGIEYYGVPEGTLKPIMEELYSELKKDPVFQEDNHPINYFVKYQNEKYILCSKVSDISYNDLKKIAHALNQLFFNQNKYFSQLRDQIIKIIKENKLEDQQVLFRLTKSLLTELMNNGYSLKYIYMVMDNLFWSPSNVVDSVDRIDEFFSLFDFSAKRYQVVFKGKRQKISRVVNYIDGLGCTDRLPDEIRSKADNHFSYRKHDETFLVIDRKALDPFDAAENAINLIETNAAVFRLYDHTYRYRIRSAECEVFDEKQVYKFGKGVRPVEHIKVPSSRRISESMEVVDNAISKIVEDESFRDYVALISAIQYHSHSLDSISEENQLLDLWAIFESVLDISNKHTADRIQQICMYLVPLLKRKYIYSLFRQLADDIKNYNEVVYEDIVGTETSSEAEIVRLVCEFTLLDSNSDKRNEVLTICSDFPLLKERIDYYCNALGTPAKVHSFVEKHAERVRWQIQRIYRNRNLIIHNGSKMPYLPLLIENLHSYVDDFISYVIHSMSNGTDINGMCQELFVKECKWNSTFPRLKDAITEDQIKYILSI